MELPTLPLLKVAYSGLAEVQREREREQESEGVRALYNAVVNRSHKRRNDYNSSNSNIDEKFYNVGESDCWGGRGMGKSFPQFSLSGTNAFGVGFSLWLRIWLETL